MKLDSKPPELSPDKNSAGENHGCLFALLSAIFGGAGTKSDSAVSAYTKKQYFFSKAERSFYEVLKHAVGSDYIVFAKVRLCDLIDPPRGKGRQSALNKITSKHVDFVLCEPAALKPVLVIELDDSSHQTEKRRARDTFLDAALESACLPILHQPCKDAYSMELLRQEITQKLSE